MAMLQRKIPQDRPVEVIRPQPATGLPKANFKIRLVGLVQDFIRMLKKLVMLNFYLVLLALATSFAFVVIKFLVRGVIELQEYVPPHFWIF